MICPVEIARDMSALHAVRVRDHAKHGFLPQGRDGADDESTGSNLAGDGETDHVVFGNSTITVTASFGIAGFCGTKPPDLNDLVSRADTALYRAKRNGRDRIQFEEN